jgi:DNA polymerase-3 subunit gamma/tau
MTALPGLNEATGGQPAKKDGEYVVVARRYRPQDFSQLVGQNQVSQALGNAIATNRVGHAYLFTGARGVGKTSTARIFSKALNCVNGPTSTPCGECDICRGIASGEDVDVIEIDGASNRGIDEIRQLRQNVNIRPSRARFKIYIIDEVHMLTNQAFNALLKTLEEPPEHVKFIFCTTEADKIPITVLSRCQRFDFAPIETKSIIARLHDICKSEEVEAEPEALQILARRAAGSMRDSQSLLEQLLSFGGTKVTVDDIHSMLGTARSSRLAAIAEKLAGRDTAGALQEVDAAVGEGVDLGQFAEQLLGYYRDALAALVGCSPDLMLHTTSADFDKLQTLAQQTGLETLLAIAQILDQSLARMRQSTHVRTLIEIALVRICSLENLDQLPGLIAQVRDGLPIEPRSTSRPSPAAGSPATPATSVPPRSASRSPAELSASELPPSQREAAPPGDDESAAIQKKTPVIGAENEPEVSAKVVEHPSLAPQQVLGMWQQALATIDDMASAYASKAASVAISGPNRLVVRFRKAYTQALQFCQRADRMQRIEQALAEVGDRPWQIEFELLPDEPESPSARNVPRLATPNRMQRIRAVEKHPLIRSAIELFDAEVVKVIEPPVAEEPETTAATVADIEEIAKGDG